MIETSETVAALMAALVKAQSEMEAVQKDAKNPHFKNRYASLENVINTARPILTKNGLGWTQAPQQLAFSGERMATVDITTRIFHVSGEWMQSTLEVPLAKPDAQGVGSAITYGCRYALMAILGLPPTDDDGEAAGLRPEKFQTPSQFEQQVKASLDVEPVKPASAYAARDDAGDAKRMSAYAARKDGAWTELLADLHACQTRDAVVKLWSSPAVRGVVTKWPTQWQEEWKTACSDHVEDLRRLATDELSGLEGAMP